MKWLVFILIVCFNLSLYSQQIQVKNVVSYQSGSEIFVNYDLVGTNDVDLFSISLLVSNDGGQTYSNPLQKVSGNVGFLQKGGIGKQIKWNLLEEVSQLVAENVVFKVKVELVPEFARNLVFVEGGSFQMGSNDQTDDEKPAHEVKVDNFYISKYETTVKDYKQYCKETTKSLPQKEIEWIDDHPMTFVSWDDANEYCNWLSSKTGKTFRLPSEAEWEYAAKGASTSKNTLFSGSDNINDVGWDRENSIGSTHSKVGILSPNEIGIFDMTGNVWEWCSDYYSKTYYLQSASINPKGPRAGTVKIARGGSWYHPKVSVTYRFYMTPTAKSNYMGFRIVMEP
jgi:formylglycine-generating enzyme required for sulfatase activity